MSMLLHACCGPCAMYPVDFLLNEGREFDLYWYNPNIHPVYEWNRRLENLQKASDHYNVKLIRDGGEGYIDCREEYWKSKEYLDIYSSRCDMCYDIRLENVARFASENGYDSICTTLLVSPYQQHEKICDIARQKADKYGIEFDYYDFRPGFREGQNMARDIGLYRQKYCGCIFSLDESKFKDKILKSFEE
ncbi:MAG: epoxyqueuosine reductase QueH [Saccharofermentans sp.]|nr:epoxyqueuosine reductase QueH [Saccharofermentans sp.]